MLSSSRSLFHEAEGHPIFNHRSVYFNKLAAFIEIAVLVT